MTRLIAVSVALVFALAHPASGGAPKQTRQGAYKPAERRQRQQEADAQPAPGADAAAAAGTAYEQEVQAAKEQRDKELAEAAATETDRRALEKRKQEIFSQYAAILAAIRDKYQAAQGQDPADAPAGPARRGKASRQREADAPPANDDAAAGRERGRKSRGSGDALAAAQQKLDEENQRHQQKLGQLNAQLRQAEASGSQREVRRVQKSIEKENNAYETKRLILERRVQELGGSAPAADGAR